MSSFGGINPSVGLSYLTIGEGSKMEDESHLIADEDVVDKTKPEGVTSMSLRVPDPVGKYNWTVSDEDHDAPTKQSSMQGHGFFVRCYSAILSIVEKNKPQHMKCNAVLNKKLFILGITMLMSITLICGIVAFATSGMHRIEPPGKSKLMNSENHVGRNTVQP